MVRPMKNSVRVILFGLVLAGLSACQSAPKPTVADEARFKSELADLWVIVPPRSYKAKSDEQAKKDALAAETANLWYIVPMPHKGETK